jgi:hypothetical protein
MLGHILAVEIGELAQRYPIGDAFAQLAIIRKHSVRTAGMSGQAASLAALGFQFHGRSWSIR